MNEHAITPARHDGTKRGSISRRLGLVFLSLGGVILLIIGITYKTFAGLASDRDRQELSRAQEEGVFLIQLKTLDFLRGEDRADEIHAEWDAYEARRDDLFGDAGSPPTNCEQLARAWKDYRETCSRVLEAQRDLGSSADATLQQFAPWLSTLSSLEARMDPSLRGYEDHIGILVFCRSASSNLNSSFFKLVTAPPGDPERQARLSLTVAVETITEMLADLRDDVEEETPSPSSRGALVSLTVTEEAWQTLQERLAQVSLDKAELRELVGPSKTLNLADSFTEVMGAQQEASRRYEELAAARQALLKRILAASAVLVILLIAFAMVIVRRSVVDPIRRLTEGTSRLAGGDLSARIETKARDEIGLLAQSFNAMAGSIDSSHRQLKEWADTLELQVRERTEELRGANEKLVEEGQQRERIEGELRLAQKLEAVGQLSAGIAHEINTPMQFVGDNVKFLQEVVAETALVFEKTKELATSVRDGASTPADGEALLALMQRADIEYRMPESAAAIEQALEGIQRVSKIVRSMKEFSHPGSVEMTLADLAHGIESTVTVATSEWKYVADMELDFDPDLPAVLCQLGEINQVVLNMIVNASHAIAELPAVKAGGKGTIRISTRQDGDQVEIRIADSGAGIPEEIRERVFDQFFTTKEVGRGTGQGLSIAHTVIVAKHGGTLRLESEVGKGTTFIIRIPISRASSEVTLEAA